MHPESKSFVFEEMREVELLKNFSEQISSSQYPFLNKQKDELAHSRVLEGLRLIHNSHMTWNTVLKLVPLLSSGAELTVTATSNLIVDAEVIEFMKKIKLNIRTPSEIDRDCDIVLDCCAGLANHVTPRLGVVELTQTGSAYFRKSKVAYPVLDLDRSLIKELECVLGTGDGFLRGFQAYVGRSILNRKFVVFGGGKVGRGIVRALIPYTKNIVCIDMDPVQLNQVPMVHTKILLTSDSIGEIKDSLKDTFCVVTATGKKGAISALFDRSDFNSCEYLANMGSEDEYGVKFEPSDVLFQKRMLNFSLSHPTQIKYLDPVFYAHHFGATLLAAGTGVSEYPLWFDKKILNEWAAFHHENLNEVILGHRLD